MSPILGIYASQISGHLIPPSSFYNIATVTVSGSTTTSVTFSGISGTYKSLQIRAIAKDLATTTFSDNSMSAIFNGDTGSNYVTHTLSGNGTAVTAANPNGAPTINFSPKYGEPNSGSSDTATWGVSIWDIHDYASTTKNKTVRVFSGSNNNTTSTNFGVALSSAVWLSTSAITSITINSWYQYFAANTTFALYGIN